MAKTRLGDVVFVLPGITGSVLRKDGKDLWAVTGQSIWKTLTTRGKWIDQLELEGDDADDGVEATRILPDIHIVPGLKKVDGYSGIMNFLRGSFEVVEGRHDDDRPANLVPFPYDWRRDNRISAALLEQAVQRKLRAWRDHTNNPEAKAILVGHSMGGLVARWYLHVMDGWKDCKALVTFGTPYRGSVDAVGYVENGYKKLIIDLSAVMRSFTSVYQLMPVYQMVEQDGDWKRVTEAKGFRHIDQTRAEDALQFHRDIEDAEKQNRADPDYERFTVLPFVGTRQKTLQSASLADGRLTVSSAIPGWIDAVLEEGDGTVPRLSAIPIELSDEYRDTFVPEKHASLQNHRGVLADLHGRLGQMQVKNLAAIRGPELRPEPEAEAALSLEIDDLYVPDEPVSITVGGRSLADDAEVEAVLEPVEPAGDRRMVPLPRVGDDRFEAPDVDVPAGVYRVEVRTVQGGPTAPSPVHDVFEVLR